MANHNAKGKHLELTWVKVKDAQGRKHMEAHWVVVKDAAATHAA